MCLARKLSLNESKTSFPSRERYVPLTYIRKRCELIFGLRRCFVNGLYTITDTWLGSYLSLSIGLCLREEEKSRAIQRYSSSRSSALPQTARNFNSFNLKRKWQLRWATINLKKLSLIFCVFATAYSSEKYWRKSFKSRLYFYFIFLYSFLYFPFIFAFVCFFLSFCFFVCLFLCCLIVVFFSFVQPCFFFSWQFSCLYRHLKY